MFRWIRSFFPATPTGQARASAAVGLFEQAVSEIKLAMIEMGSEREAVNDQIAALAHRNGELQASLATGKRQLFQLNLILGIGDEA